MRGPVPRGSSIPSRGCQEVKPGPCYEQGCVVAPQETPREKGGLRRTGNTAVRPRLPAHPGPARGTRGSSPLQSSLEAACHSAPALRQGPGQPAAMRCINYNPWHHERAPAPVVPCHARCPWGSRLLLAWPCRAGLGACNAATRPAFAGGVRLSPSFARLPGSEPAGLFPCPTHAPQGHGRVPPQAWAAVKGKPCIRAAPSAPV